MNDRNRTNFGLDVGTGSNKSHAKTRRREEIAKVPSNTRKENMTENELSKIIVDTCYRIHVSLGPGLFESVYEEILSYELTQKGLHVSRQKGIPVIWQDVKMNLGFRADLIVDNKVLIEVKSIEAIAPVHQKQVLTYLKLAGLKLGLLVNFNEALIKDGVTRIVHKL